MATSYLSNSSRFTSRLSAKLFPWGVNFTHVLALTGLASIAHADVQKDEDWAGNKRILIYEVDPGTDTTFADDVDKAAKEWNDKNTGWTLKKKTGDDKADIKVKRGELSLNGETDKDCTKSGGKVKIQSATITINSNGTVGPRVRTLVHEFGHCMRLKHVADNGQPGGDVMEESQGENDTNTTPTENDVKEAKDAAATQQAAIVAVPGAAVFLQDTVVTLTPEPGTTWGLGGATSVLVEALDPVALGLQVLSVSSAPEQVLLRVTPSATSIHHEFLKLVVTNALGSVSRYDGRLNITLIPEPSGQLPIAVATPYLSANPNMQFLLDGTGSSSPAPGGSVVSHWDSIQNDEQLRLHGYKSVEYRFPAYGTYELDHVVEDIWGRVSKATSVVRVDPYVLIIEGGSEGCLGEHQLGVNSSPHLGNLGFEIGCDHAPPLGSGVLIVAPGLANPAGDLLGLGAEILLDVSNPDLLLLTPMIAGQNGFASVSAPIPNTPSAHGYTFHAQALWWSSNFCAAAPLGWSSSNALSITLHE